MTMFKDGKDQGYKSNPQWWWDPTDPDHYRFADLDNDYPAEYFPLAEPPRVKEFVQTVMDYYQKLTGKPLHSVIEFGCGGGWYLREFLERGIYSLGYEGSTAGILACNARRVWPEQADFRRHIPRGGYGDIILCTEVAEHAEVPFHGTLVNHLVNRSGLVWFSAEGPGGPEHLHHPSKMPFEYWIKLFAFFGYGCHMLPDEIMVSTENRGRAIFYDKKRYQL